MCDELLDTSFRNLKDVTTLPPDLFTEIEFGSLEDTTKPCIILWVNHLHNLLSVDSTE